MEAEAKTAPSPLLDTEKISSGVRFLSHPDVQVEDVSCIDHRRTNHDSRQRHCQNA
jgi:hypothetical protein